MIKGEVLYSVSVIDWFDIELTLEDLFITLEWQAKELGYTFLQINRMTYEYEREEVVVEWEMTKTVPIKKEDIEVALENMETRYLKNEGMTEKNLRAVGKITLEKEDDDECGNK